jgi:hypothetical protein
MRKRRLSVGIAMILASLVWYDFVQVSAAGPPFEQDVAHASGRTTTPGTRVLLPPKTAEIREMISAVSDSTVLFATGVTLLGVAARVRRHCR